MEIEVSDDSDNNKSNDIHQEDFDEPELKVGNETLERALPNFADHKPDMSYCQTVYHYAMHAYAIQKGVQFLGYGGKGLEKCEVADKRKDGVLHKIKNLVLFLVALSLCIIIVGPYLSMLGTQKSQSTEDYKMLNFQFSIAQLNELLPVHQFMIFSKDQLEAKMACSLKNDPAACHNSQERLCISKGINTMEYHQCIIQLLESEKGDPIQFCKDHYDEMQIWTGEKSPDELLYYKMKHDCLQTSGVKLGGDYCIDINHHTANATTEDLFKCFRKYEVEYSGQYCDHANHDDDDEFIKCYDAKDVPKNSKYCEIVYEGDLEGLILCYEEADIASVRFCDLKYSLTKQNKIEAVAQEEVQQCYKDLNFTLDVQFCEQNYEKIDDKYSCFSRIGFTNFTKDRVYCERKDLKSSAAKFSCLDRYDIPKLGEYCHNKFFKKPDYETKHICLHNQGVPKTAQYCSGKFKSKRDHARKNKRTYDISPENQCMEDLGIPQFGVSICTIPFSEDLDLEATRALIKDFTNFKHQYLEDELDAAFPDYFIDLIKSDLGKKGFDEAILNKYRQQNPQPSLLVSTTNTTGEASTEPTAAPTLMKTQMTYKIQGKNVVLSKSPDRTTWLYNDMKPLLLQNGKHLYSQDLEIETLLQAYVGDSITLTPGQEFPYNYEQKGTIKIKSSTILGRTLFRNKYDMKELIQKMDADKKFKPEFFKAHEEYWGKELYENRTALEQPVYSNYRGFPSCLDQEVLEFEQVCNSTYDKSQPENRKGCLFQLSQYGYFYQVEPQYCLNKQEVVSDKFYYQTKHKYECFADEKFHPQPIRIDDEALDCLGLNYDFEIEQCLQNYEAAVGDELTLSDDPLNLYYGRKRIEKTEEGEKKEEEMAMEQSDVISYDFGSIKPEEYYVNYMEGGSYEFDDVDFQRFICGNTNMNFYSNPKGGLPKLAVNRTLHETQITLNCSTFDLRNTENQLVAHFSMPDLSKSTLPDIYVNRTDENQQYFLTTFDEPLSFVTAISQIMYVGHEIKSDIKIDANDYRAFIDDLHTSKLVQIGEQVINEQVIEPTYLRTTSRKNRRYGFVSVLNILGYDLLFADKNETLMNIQPKNEPTLAYKSSVESQSSNQMILKFSFVESVWTYKYYQFTDILESLGGLGNALGVILVQLSLILVWLYFLDMIRVIYGRYKNDWITTRNQQLKARVGNWKKVIEILIQKQKVDEGSGSTLEGDLRKSLKKKPIEKSKKFITLNFTNSSLEDDLRIVNALENETWDINDPDKMDQLEKLQETYGSLEASGDKIKKIVKEPETSSPSFDDKLTILQITQTRLKFSFYKIAAMIKSRISFFSIYQHEDEIELLKARHDLLQKQCQNVMQKMLKGQAVLEARLLISEAAQEKGTPPTSTKCINQEAAFDKEKQNSEKSIITEDDQDTEKGSNVLPIGPMVNYIDFMPSSFSLTVSPDQQDKTNP